MERIRTSRIRSSLMRRNANSGSERKNWHCRTLRQYGKIRNEGYENLPLYDEHAPGWQSGRKLLALQMYECCVTGALVPDSLRLKAGGKVMSPGTDFRVNDFWGTVGRRGSLNSGFRQFVRERFRSMLPCCPFFR